MTETIRITSEPRITGFAPSLSSSLPPASAPSVPVIVSRIPKMPSWIAPQPKVPAA